MDSVYYRSDPLFVETAGTEMEGIDRIAKAVAGMR